MSREGGPGDAALAHQVPRYVVVAGTTTLLYLLVLAGALSSGIHYMWAILIAQMVAIALAFPIYRRFVFRSSGRWRPDLCKFISVWTTGALYGAVGTPLLVELLGFHPLSAQVLAIVLVASGTYMAHRLFSFSHRGNGFRDHRAGGNSS